ncbi:MAG: YkgJ family cysteine cluster protein [Nitrospirae bacterium]|nr:YkgJ family cysteine cluster protein [Nitrospirota bacterium]
MKVLQTDIQQVVPPAWCADCDVCCRFPERDSFLAPYFTPEEIAATTEILGGGTEFNSVPNANSLPLKGRDRACPRSIYRGVGMGLLSGKPKTGCKITLIPYKEGYICPAFNPATTQCKIYDARPIDCKLYPFAILWDPSGKEVLLGVDTKCPFVTEHAEDGLLKEASLEIASAIESPPLLDILASNRDLIGPYQDDVIPLFTLKGLTSRII